MVYLSNMKIAPKEKRQLCVAFATKILGDKWTPLILTALFSKKLRFSELQNTVSPINPRTLSARLDFLEANCIITRTVYQEVPTRVEYELTNQGKDLVPILKSMGRWGDKYYDQAHKKH